MSSLTTTVYCCARNRAGTVKCGLDEWPFQKISCLVLLLERQVIHDTHARAAPQHLFDSILRGHDAGRSSNCSRLAHNWLTPDSYLALTRGALTG